MSKVEHALGVRHVLSANEAAQILKVSAKQVTRWCMDGTLEGAEKPEGITTAWIIPAASVKALAERRTAELLERLPEVAPGHALAASEEVA